MIVLLDAGPLGILSNPRATPTNNACRAWLRSLVAAGIRVVLPEITDYEVRRELIRIDSTASIRRLDALAQEIRFEPITTEIMKRAAHLWADARRQGRPMADPSALDADVILAAPALLLADGGENVVVATDNARHLARFVQARRWQDIHP